MRSIASTLGMIALVAAGCAPRVEEAATPAATAPAITAPAVPHGYSARLLISDGGQLYRFGPFVGYYFRPIERGDFSEVEFVCFNEDGFYTDDLPAGAKLFTGRGVMRRLEPVEGAMPDEGGRIRPVFFDAAPEPWLADRPEPQDEFVHFHSTYNASGATWLGYWLRHRAVAEFTYDMGGRLSPDSPLYHHVTPGVDRDVARVIEFDFGPGRAGEDYASH
jgi:hypothetical protein